MALLTAATEPAELVLLEEAKRHLRILSSDFDDEVQQKLTAARQNCELWMGRTFTEPRLRTWSMSDWWSGSLKLPYPPLIVDGSHTLTVQYYDANNANQTLASTNYDIVYSDAFTYLEWADDSVLPSVATRPDAVRVAFYTGWTELPQRYAVAILMELTRLWGDAKGRDMDQAERCATSLKNSLDTGTYA